MNAKNMYSHIKACIVAAMFAIVAILVCLTIMPDTASAKQIFVGDSRTTGMYDAVNKTSYSVDLNVHSGDTFWRARNAAGFGWLQSEGMSFIDQYASNGDDVIVSIGVNDCPSEPSLGRNYSASDYLSLLNSNASGWKKRNINVIYVLPGPVDDYKAAWNGYWHKQYLINEFNAAMKSGLSSNIKYFDLSEALINSGFLSTEDGVHYGHDVYLKIYEAEKEFAAEVRRSSSDVPPLADTPTFTFHRDDIKWAYSSGVSTGWDNGNATSSFRPYWSMTRADMAAFLHRMAVKWGVAGAAGYSASDSQRRVFKDVKSSTPHAQDIWWLEEYGIATGWNGSEFRPYDTVKRQDMAAFLFRLAKLAGRGGASDAWQPSSVITRYFSDVSSNDPYNHRKETLWLAEKGISTGWNESGGSHTFRGMYEVKRCDMAAFLHRFEQLTSN